MSTKNRIAKSVYWRASCVDSKPKKKLPNYAIPRHFTIQATSHSLASNPMTPHSPFPPNHTLRTHPCTHFKYPPPHTHTLPPCGVALTEIFCLIVFLKYSSRKTSAREEYFRNTIKQKFLSVTRRMEEGCQCVVEGTRGGCRDESVGCSWVERGSVVSWG